MLGLLSVIQFHFITQLLKTILLKIIWIEMFENVPYLIFFGECAPRNAHGIASVIRESLIFDYISKMIFILAKQSFRLKYLCIFC